MSGATIAWYGERGIINALVTELAKRADPALAARELLAAIRWADRQQPAWISKVKHATYIVETALAEFGSPDLILVARCDGDTVHVVFVEAKAKPYAFSALRNNAGMTARGFNSSINGQLTLKYRFSEALRGWDGVQPNIAEPRFLWLAYQSGPADGGLGDPCSRPRHVQKRAVLSLLSKFQVHGLAADHYHFVALTLDHGSFWEQEVVVTGQLLPLFLTPVPNAGSCWDAMRGRIGSLTYESIEEHLKPGEPYKEALATMKLATPEPVLCDRTENTQLAGRTRGVSIIFAPALCQGAEHTAVHLSWNGDNALIRIYGEEGVPTEVTRQTLDVFGQINPDRERKFGPRNRPRWDDVDAWREIIAQINREWGIE